MSWGDIAFRGIMLSIAVATGAYFGHSAACEPPITCDHEPIPKHPAPIVGAQYCLNGVDIRVWRTYDDEVQVRQADVGEGDDSYGRTKMGRRQFAAATVGECP